MIRIDSIWLGTKPMDKRAGTETALARVIAVFGAAKPHCAYLFANRRATRMKVLVHEGFGVWLAARRLNQGKLHWPGIRHGPRLAGRWQWRAPMSRRQHSRWLASQSQFTRECVRMFREPQYAI